MYYVRVLCVCVLHVWVCVGIHVCLTNTAGDDSGSLPGPAERLHHPLPGSYETRGSLARCATSRGGHVSSPPRPLCPGQSQSLPKLH